MVAVDIQLVNLHDILVAQLADVLELVYQLNVRNEDSIPAL